MLVAARRDSCFGLFRPMQYKVNKQAQVPAERIVKA